MFDAALEQLDTGILIIDTDFVVTFMNEACERILDVRREDALGRNIDEFFNHPSQHIRNLQQTLEEEREITLDVLSYKGGKHDKFLRQQTRLLREGGTIVGAMTELKDITSYVKKERELQAIIRNMTVNIVPVTDKIGALPLQPIIDESHKHILLERTLTLCMSLRLEKLAIDLTAIPSMDDEVAHSLMRLIEALRLIGTEVIITGIRPEVAMTLVTSGYNLDECPSFAHLSQALAYFTAV